MNQTPRWKQAQDAEISHKQRIKPFNIPAYFSNHFNCSASEALSGADIIEVGCGTGGMIYSMSEHINTTGEIIGIDPILPKTNNTGLLGYPVIGAGGEQIPCENNSFDVAISTNVLDHVLSPTDVLNEIHRVLRPSGELYLKVNVFGRPKPVRRLFDRIDIPHPHHFSSTEIFSLLSDCSYKIEYKNLANRTLSDRSISDWSIKWIMGHVIGGFDTLYVRATPASSKK